MQLWLSLPLSQPLPDNQATTAPTTPDPNTPSPSINAPAAPASACIDLPEQSTLIARLVADPTLRRALLELTHTSTGTRFLDYLFYMLSTVGPGFLSWDFHAGWRDPGAWSTPGGMIVVNWDSSSTEVANGSMIIQEATELHFDSLGIRQMGTQHADYVAQLFSGKFLAEEHARGIHLGGFGYGSYGLSFAQWLASDESAWFRYELADVYLHEGNRWLAGYAWQEGHPMVDVRDAPNPIGLAPHMLTAAMMDPAAAAR